MAQRWSDLSSSQRRTIVVVGVVETALKVAMAVDLKRRPPEQIRGPKWVWATATLVNSAGIIPVAYFLFGRVK
ncbi:hypothetical protein AMIS_41530 [Actinoplanes missouriensis 431]|uniref:DUF5652 domain-containing protein n=1 Tax=Actinoplanes missouriensis (strain ATCC 14538 / DSM 43046 / CBS 188.64 / JCM 3121 / NBRC 102363 / NCIMB 12654 / NRRL B-3342 / UNCC 431) TaxID=512565 RepID=I0H8N6_ACTM4|nr:hypothetical protein [Actinoplanes missouriensis]BAL89373.1 hypothetical protein AMIS_41530 [Actinoplanes missouriensis 431]